MFFDVNTAAKKAAADESLKEKFILKYENFIIKTASTSAKRFITKHDDEWSIALIAFSNAVDSFDSNRGNFLSFAKLLISERLIDFYRHQSRFSSEIKTDPYVFNGDVDEVSDSLGYELSVVGKLVTDNENRLADEIDALNGCLAGYGISFYDLPASSPKTKRTRESCRRIIFFLKENDALMDGIRKKGYLPIKEIEKNTKSYKKFIERYRNYIIAGVEILKGDYPGLQDYFLNQK